jgi:dTDP-4-dehydrorhamnose reductase
MTMKTILVTGANGQLGNAIRSLAGRFTQFQFEFTDVAELDITNAEAIRGYFDRVKPFCVINCAAYTAVDRAESDATLAELLNATAPKLLAEAAELRAAVMVQVSTDYVFDGKSHLPYVETMPTSPDSVYGWTKLRGEQYVMAACSRAMVVRTAWLYSAVGNNFVKTMLRLGRERGQLGVIYDQVGTPTYATDLAEALLLLVSQVADGGEDLYGTYHFTNEGVCSWYDFATEIFRQSGVACNVKPIETKDYPTAAKRPHYSVLNKAKIKAATGMQIPHWVESLKVCLSELGERV